MLLRELQLARTGFSTLIAWRELERNQWRTRDHLRDLQNKLLRRMVRHACDHVRYYSRLFKSLHIEKDDIRTVEDMSKIPVLTKDQIRNSPGEFYAHPSPFEFSRTITSSGSTGIPPPILQGEEDLAYDAAEHMREFRAWRVDLRKRWALIRTHHGLPRLESHVQKLFYRNCCLSSVYEDAERQIAKLRSVKPHFLYIVPSYLSYLIEVGVRKDLELFPLETIFANGDQLARRASEMVVNAFGVEPNNMYGTAETGAIAWQCPEERRHHLNVDNCLVEFLDENDEPVGVGEKGMIVVTCFHNPLMPLIRFSVGDYGVPSDDVCACGRGLPIMNDLLGEIRDVLLFGGRAVNPFLLERRETLPSGIAWTRFIQTEPDELTVQFMRTEFSRSGCEEQLLSRIQYVVGSDVHVELDEVDAIPKDPYERLVRVKAYQDQPNSTGTLQDPPPS